MTVLQDVVTSVVVDLVVQGVTFVGMLGFLLYINWKLTLVAFAILPLAALVIDRTSKKMRGVGHHIQEQLARFQELPRRLSPPCGCALLCHGGAGAGAFPGSERP